MTAMLTYEEIIMPAILNRAYYVLKPCLIIDTVYEKYILVIEAYIIKNKRKL
jgi:hypothetical protein